MSEREHKEKVEYFRRLWEEDVANGMVLKTFDEIDEEIGRLRGRPQPPPALPSKVGENPQEEK